jgi:hypothetical protein
MTETNPPLPKSGGSTPFVIAAIVMLLLMGGLIYWKVGGSGEEPKAQKPTPAASITQAAALEEPPPPPPPPDEEADAGKATEKTIVKKTGGGGGGGCNAVCEVEASSQLQAALRAKAGLARGCYERALRQNSMLQGRLRVGVKIGPAGNVCAANVVSNELGDPGVASCVIQMFRSGSFPAPGKGCVDAQVPLNFQPKT